jgi:uncharacterized SAM-binding protein YcdF (DUF218 family)
MRGFLSSILNPVLLLYFLLIAGYILKRINRKKNGNIFIVLAGIWFLGITTPFLPRVLIKSLEDRYHQISDSTIKSIKGSCDIIVLGGGHSDEKDLSPNNQLSRTALSRLVEGIRIHKLIPGSRLILSGYGGRSELSQAVVLYRTALILGIDSGTMAIQTKPSNTKREAEEYIKNFGTENNLIVVTSGVHMPRAMMLFRRMSITPVAAPADIIIKNKLLSPLGWMPSSNYISMMEGAIHEYIGMLWATLGGT